MKAARNTAPKMNGSAGDLCFIRCYMINGNRRSFKESTTGGAGEAGKAGGWRPGLSLTDRPPSAGLTGRRGRMPVVVGRLREEHFFK